MTRSVLPKGPSEETIAHGYLTLSLVPRFAYELYTVEGVGFGLNYGLERVRFPSPVPVDTRVRASATIGQVKEVSQGVRLTTSFVLEADGVDKPVCIADTITLWLP